MNWAGYKTCTRCKEDKPHAEFWKNATKYDGLRSECIECASETNLKRYPDKPVGVSPESEQAIVAALRQWPRYEGAPRGTPALRVQG